MRILYVHSTVQPPPGDLQTDRFYLLSQRLEGEVLQPIWFQTPEEVEAMFGPGSYPMHTVGKFRYHWILGSPKRGIAQRLATFRFYLQKGLELHRERPFDCIVAYSHMTTGLFAGVLKLLTGARLVIEIATSPNLVYITERPRPRLRERVMKLYSDVCLHLSMLLADRAHFLYPTQLHPYPLLRKMPNSVFHEFVPVSIIDRDDDREGREQYVLLVGAPWYLKGADVLVVAFRGLAPDFPRVKLKILGHYPDPAELNGINRLDSAQIEVLKARPHPEALKVIKGAMVVVLPSRCEGLGRVLIEGMAAAVPLIGSDVGGIPMLVREGENGFLVPVGDSDALGARLRRLLEDPELRRRMGDSGYVRAHSELDEKTYVREFAGMVQAAVHKT
jgi:glycosyltransferase involved in cell wall biosynthesis